MNSQKNIHTVEEITLYGEGLFKKEDLCYYHGTTNAFDDALLLVASVLNIDLLSKQIDFQVTLSTTQRDSILTLFKKRIELKKPVAFLTNNAYFASRTFFVDERVMIPRSPFAEIINNHFAPWVAGNTLTDVMDLCTGSGALAITTALELPDVIVDAVDISTDALNVASINIKKHGVENRVNLITSDLFENINKKYDLIVSNPPYVSLEEYEDLPVEFTYEPKSAFTQDETGLNIVDDILYNASKYLKSKGNLIVEVGYSWPDVQKKYPKVPFTWIELENGGEGIFILTKEELDKYFV